MPDKVAPLIQYFVERIPGAGRTQVVKFLYLADLEARRYLGKPITNLDYIWWDFGPFDSSILSQLDELCRSGFLEGEQVCYHTGKVGWRYRATTKRLEESFPKEVSAILEFIASHYGTTSLQNLLDDVVYQTTPMVDAKKREGFGCRLRMNLVDNEARAVPGLELEKVVRAIEQLDRGQGKSLKEVVATSRR
jgi:uncharacterized phage-associated protein